VLLLYAGGYVVQRRAPVAQRPEIRKAQPVILAPGYLRRMLHLRPLPCRAVSTYGANGANVKLERVSVQTLCQPVAKE
jgi:hypothetical protein